MLKFLIKAKQLFLDFLFPKTCLICGKEKTYICQDCLSLIEINERQYCPFCSPPKITLDGRTCPSCRRKKYLNGLYFSTTYDNFIIKKLIYEFKYNRLKELSLPLSYLIIEHLLALNKNVDFSSFLLIPIPLHKSKLKERGFNQSEEITKHLAAFLNTQFLNNVLVRKRKTFNQATLNKKEREINLKNSFACQNQHLIHNQKIILVDDIFTTGATIEEGAKTLKKAGAKEVWGMVVAKGK